MQPCWKFRKFGHFVRMSMHSYWYFQWLSKRILCIFSVAGKTNSKQFLIIARKWSCGKVMFLHLSAIMLTWMSLALGLEGGVYHQTHTTHPQTQTLPGHNDLDTLTLDTHPWHTPLYTPPTHPSPVHTHPWTQPLDTHPSGHTHPQDSHPLHYGQWVDAAHSTGMLSCFKY